MAELIYRHIYKVDVANDPLIRRDVGALLGLYDKAANRFGVELYDNGTALTLSGKTVTGYMIRPDGNTVNLSGTVSGNQAYVELTENCYLYDGAFTLSVKVDAQTVLICDGQIAVTRTGTTVSGNEVINTVSNAEKLGGKPPEYYLTAVNLLDNTDFEIAQAGYGGKHGTDIYACDRWKQNDTTERTYTKVTYNGHGAITCNAETRIQQKLYLVEGQAYTASYRKNDNLQIITFTANSGSYGGGNLWVNKQSDGTYMFVMTGINANEIISEPALYKGTYTEETLPPYVPKGYAVELAECKRYYQIVSPSMGFVPYHSTTSTRSYNLVFEVEMRVKPTITIDETSVEYNHGAWSSTGATFTGSGSTTKNGIATATSTITSTERPFAFIAYAANADL